MILSAVEGQRVMPWSIGRSEAFLYSDRTDCLLLRKRMGSAACQGMRETLLL